MTEVSEREREQDNYLEHYGVLGMKWGVRKKQPAINRDRNKLIAKYQNEYIAKKALGKSTKIGKGANQMNLSRTNYAIQKADTDLRKKYGNKTVTSYYKKRTSKQLKAYGAVAVASMGVLLYATMKSIPSSKINTGKALVSAILK